MALPNVLHSLEDEGYSTSSYIVPASAAQAPHRRDRLWIVAHYNGLRSDSGKRDRQVGHIQENQKWNLEKIQQEWAQLIPDTWETFTARDWFQYNRKFSGGNDGISKRLEQNRIKAIGNAIVPQIAYVFFKLIKLISSETTK